MPADRPDRTSKFSFAATDIAVRGALATLRAQLLHSGIDAAACGKIEIAMAEAFNNIVEHAYADRSDGVIFCTITQRPDGQLCIALHDNGHALPGLDLPAGALPDNSGPLETLPEGGFGWFLIRELTEDLSYRRSDGQNHLTLRFAAPSL